MLKAVKVTVGTENLSYNVLDPIFYHHTLYIKQSGYILHYM